MQRIITIQKEVVQFTTMLSNSLQIVELSRKGLGSKAQA